ncbi:formyltransferase family protein [Patescibacteria group bacterium]
MKIVILTSYKHIYADIVIRKLFSALPDHQYLIIYQKALVAGKSKISGLQYYWRKSGARYVMAQVIKQLIILLFYRFLKPDKNIQTEIWENHKLDDIEKIISDYQPDVILSIYSKYKLSDNILSAASKYSINIHPSLLPAYKGVSPTFWVLANDEKETGVSIHKLTKSFDEGSIVAQKNIYIDKNDSEHSLYLKCSMLGSGLVIDTLNIINTNQPLTKLSENKSSSYFSLPDRSAVRKFKNNGRSFFKLSELSKKPVLN